MTKTILHIATSPMGDRSMTRKFGQKTLATLLAKHADSKVIERDLALNPLPHLDANILGAFFTPADKRDAAQHALVAPSDKAIAEVMDADIIVIEVPMWNFGIPSVLKAWIDHIARAGMTFKYTATGPVGLVPSDKKVIIVSSRGGIYSTGAGQGLDHQESYLKAAMAFIGLTNVSFVRTEGVAMGEEAAAKAALTAEQEISTIAAAA